MPRKKDKQKELGTKVTETKQEVIVKFDERSSEQMTEIDLTKYRTEQLAEKIFVAMVQSRNRNITDKTSRQDVIELSYKCAEEFIDYQKNK